MLTFSGCTINEYRCKCFEFLSSEEKEFMDSHSVMVKYRKGEMICKQGGLASHVFYMENGLSKVFLDDGVNQLVLKIVPTGSMLGLSALNDAKSTYHYSAKTYVDSEIKQIDINAFRKLLSENPLFSKEVINILSANSEQVNNRFFCLTHKQSFGRLADIILCLSDRIFKIREFELPLSRRDLAELSGMSHENVVRIIKKFDEEGLIKVEGRYFTIVDYDRLKLISERG